MVDYVLADLYLDAICYYKNEITFAKKEIKECCEIIKEQGFRRDHDLIDVIKSWSRRIKEYREKHNKILYAYKYVRFDLHKMDLLLNKIERR